jgi:hypothetical protein
VVSRDFARFGESGRNIRPGKVGGFTRLLAPIWLGVSAVVGCAEPKPAPSATPAVGAERATAAVSVPPITAAKVADGRLDTDGAQGTGTAANGEQRRAAAASRPQGRALLEPEDVRLHESRFFRQHDMFLPQNAPKFVAAVKAGFLAGQDEVLGLDYGGQQRAYPVRAICYHHVVNDQVDDQPVVITYCVICSSGIAFVPIVADRHLTFGFHGIWQGSALLYDHQTNSRWLHMNGECVEGELKGSRLTPISVVHATWKEWRADHPQTTVMAAEPKFQDRYFNRDSARRGNSFFPVGFLTTIQTRDRRLPLSELCLGVRVGEAKKAYPSSVLKRLPDGLLEDVLADEPLLILHAKETGTTRAYRRKLAGNTLQFAAVPDSNDLIELTTGSRFHRSGACFDGQLAPRKLEPVEFLQAEWYGWYALHPDTEVYTVSDADSSEAAVGDQKK